MSMTLLLAGAIVAAAIRAQSRARRADTFADQQQYLNQSIHDIDLGNPAPEDAVAALERTCGVPIHVSGMTTAAAFPQGWQDFFRSKLHDVTRAAIVRTLWMYPAGRALSPGPQIWTTPDGGISVGTSAPIVVRVYPIGDLIHALDTCPKPDPHFLPANLAPLVPGRAIAVDQIIATVVNSVRPGDWPDNGGSLGRASVFADQLIICQTPGGQSEVRHLLAALRTIAPQGRRGSEPQTAPAAFHADLAQRIPEINFQSETLEGAIDHLREMTRSNILVYWQDLAASGVKRNTPVRIHLWNTTLGGALDVLIAYVADGQPVHHDVRDNIIRIGTDDLLLQDAGHSLRVYDLRDIVAAMLSFHGEHAGAPAGFATSTQKAPGSNPFPDFLTAQDAADRIIDVIQNDVYSDTWKANGGATGTIYSIAGRLVITQTPEAHKRVVTLLRALRSGGSKEGMELFQR